MHTDPFENLRPEIRAALETQRAIFHAMTTSAPDWLELDLSTGQLKTLMTLSTRGGMTVSEIADALRVGKPAASTLVDRLVRQGYAERSEDQSDRRRTIVVLSDAGAALAERLRQGGGSRLMIRWLEGMTAADLDALIQGLRALAAIAERESGRESGPTGEPDAAHRSDQGADLQSAR